MVEVNAVLEENGLSQNEIKVYLAYLRSGSLSIPDLRKRTGLPESTARDNIGFLIKRGLVRQITKGAHNVYAAEYPKNLVAKLRARLARLQAIVPKLSAMENKWRQRIKSPK